MNKTITSVFVKETYVPINNPLRPSSIMFEFDVIDGMIPGILIEYEDGDKILMIVPDAPMFSFRHQVVSFKVEEYAWNSKLNKWDKTDTGSFSSNSSMLIDNQHLVNSVTGQDRELFYNLVDDLTKPILDMNGINTGTYQQKEELIDLESNPTFVGEFKFWMDHLGKVALIPPIHNTLEEFFLKRNPNDIV